MLVFLKVNIGEPHLLVAFGVRGRTSILSSNVETVAGDQDFHVVNFTPSGCIHVDIKPNEGQDMSSHYRGKLHLYYFILLQLLLLRLLLLLIDVVVDDVAAPLAAFDDLFCIAILLQPSIDVAYQDLLLWLQVRHMFG